MEVKWDIKHQLKKGEMQFCLARLKLQFTIYNITTNISVEESWKCTVWPKVFFNLFCLFLSLTKKEGGLCQFSNSHLHYWGFTNVQFYSQKGLCPLTAGYICIWTSKKLKEKYYKVLYICKYLYQVYTTYLYKAKKGYTG